MGKARGQRRGPPGPRQKDFQEEEASSCDEEDRWLTSSVNRLRVFSQQLFFATKEGQAGEVHVGSNGPVRADGVTWSRKWPENISSTFCLSTETLPCSIPEAVFKEHSPIEDSVWKAVSGEASEDKTYKECLQRCGDLRGAPGVGTKLDESFPQPPRDTSAGRRLHRLPSAFQIKSGVTVPPSPAAAGTLAPDSLINSLKHSEDSHALLVPSPP